jgi:2'-5' RNA ligase
MTLDRAFLAIPLPQQTQNLVAGIQSDLSSQTRNLRWTHPETLHLTLHFFGKLPEENLEKIKASMLFVGFNTRPFQVDIQGLGVFPNIRRPRVLWLGLVPAKPLQELYRTWWDSLSLAGMPLESKPFIPHLTIGRFRRKEEGLGNLLKKYDTHRFGDLSVTQLVLYESRLTARRAEHIPVHSVELEG